LQDAAMKGRTASDRSKVDFIAIVRLGLMVTLGLR